MSTTVETTCQKCGKPLIEGSTFCNHCGAKQEAVVATETAIAPIVDSSMVKIAAPWLTALVVIVVGYFATGLSISGSMFILCAFSLVASVGLLVYWLAVSASANLKKTEGLIAKSKKTRNLMLATMATCFVAGGLGSATAGVPPGYQQSPEELAAQQAQEQQARQVADSPANFIKTIIREGGAHPKADIVAGDGDVEYSLDPWALTGPSARGTFLDQAAQIVPAFFNKYPKLNKIDITGDATMTDDRGNSAVDRVITLTFTRKNASTVNWGKVDFSNIPNIADYFWDHPSLRQH